MSFNFSFQNIVNPFGFFRGGHHGGHRMHHGGGLNGMGNMGLFMGGLGGLFGGIGRLFGRGNNSVFMNNNQGGPMMMPTGFPMVPGGAGNGSANDES